MVLDHQSTYFHSFRDNFSLIVTPAQFFIDYPIKTIQSLKASVAAQRALIEENARLRAHQLLLESKLQRLLALERENLQLRDLLKSTPEVAGRVIVAQLLAVSLDPALHQVVVDKGKNDKIYNGQPVLDAYGIMGQVINVGPLTSQVLLITDSRSAIPVKSSRTGIRGIVVGLGDQDKLALINMLDTVDVKVGDVFVSSGLGLRFPVGYPVGVVAKVESSQGQQFTTISLKPSAHLNQSQQVLLAWPSRASLAQEVNQQLEQSLPQVKR